jgi:SAM-dependent methyltransferase
MPWNELTSWWLQEVRSDPAYEEVVTPLLLEVFTPEAGHRYLDLGCGEGRVKKVVGGHGAEVIGLDVSEELVRVAGYHSLTASLPGIPLRPDCLDGVYLVLVLEHVADHRRLFEECARVTKRNGIMALVMNHPVWTAPGSTPITDADGEVLWRPGDYFGLGSTDVPAGDRKVTFHHRSMSQLLSAASQTGWALEQMVERPHHELEDQTGIPRLLACRWQRL